MLLGQRVGNVGGGPIIAGRVAALDFALDLPPDFFASPCDRIEPRGGSRAFLFGASLGLAACRGVKLARRTSLGLAFFGRVLLYGSDPGTVGTTVFRDRLLCISFGVPVVITKLSLSETRGKNARNANP
jgi:hypothetical protein